jgi:hypothetical protein
VTLIVDEARDGVRRPDSGGIQTRRWRGFGQRQRHSQDGVSEAVRTAAAARSERRCTVGTPARGPDSAFNARAWCGTWQPPDVDSGV